MNIDHHANQFKKRLVARAHRKTNSNVPVGNAGMRKFIGETTSPQRSPSKTQGKNRRPQPSGYETHADLIHVSQERHGHNNFALDSGVDNFGKWTNNALPQINTPRDKHSATGFDYKQERNSQRNSLAQRNADVNIEHL